MTSLDYVSVRDAVTSALREETNYKRVLQVLADVQPDVIAAIDAEIADGKTLAQLVSAGE